MAQRQFGRIIRAAQWESFKGMVWKAIPCFRVLHIKNTICVTPGVRLAGWYRMSARGRSTRNSKIKLLLFKR